MKKIFALAAILVVGSAGASELKFGDLNYFLKQGQINAGLDWVVNNETARSSNADDLDFDGHFYQARFGYALTSELNLTLGLTYLLNGETETNKGPSADDSGLLNPKIGINYRLLNQASSGFNLDFGTNANVKLIDREVGTVDKEGNNPNPTISNYSDPRSNLEFNARVGKKWNEANEFYLLGGVIYNLDGDYKQLQGNTVERDSSLDFKLGGFYQYRPVNEFMMNFGVVGTRFGEVEGKDGNADYTITDHLNYEFNFDAKYLINDSLIAKFSFIKHKRDNFDVEKNSGDVKFDKRNAVQYGIGIDYLF
jgi:hypothetical protein